jgi:hypothetical protein
MSDSSDPFAGYSISCFCLLVYSPLEEYVVNCCIVALVECIYTICIDYWSMIIN